MTSPTGMFAPPSERDVTRLVLEHPFAWVVTTAEGETRATPLPLRPVLGENGEVNGLIGHFARSNPHVDLELRLGEVLGRDRTGRGCAGDADDRARPR